MEKVSKKRLYLSPSITVVEIKPHTLLVESGELHRTSEKVDDDYEALTDELCTVRELYDSLDDFINFIIDNME